MPSKSKTQRRLMGWAYSVKKAGKKSKKYKEAPQNIKDLADSMTKKDLKDFAKTDHKGLPEKKKKKNESHIKSFSDFVFERYGIGKGYPDHLQSFTRLNKVHFSSI
jgi:hypothetical protein